MPPRRKASPPPVLHGLEAQLMDELWRLEEASVRDVMQAINAREAKQRAYTTFLTTADRLRIKGLLKRRRKGKTDFYAPVMPRDAYLEARSRAGADALVDQFGDRALAHFARHIDQLDARRRRALRKLAQGD